jgi:hypothetical protein
MLLARPIACQYKLLPTELLAGLIGRGRLKLVLGKTTFELRNPVIVSRIITHSSSYSLHRITETYIRRKSLFKARYSPCPIYQNPLPPTTHALGVVL